MHKHCRAFVGSWIVLSVALFIFPGFEVRGFAMGMIIGYWPALISKQIYESQHQHPFIFLFMMLILSGVTVGLLTLVLDKAQMTKRIWVFLGLAIIVSSTILAINGLSYENWQRTPAISQAMESPEVNYQPNHWDFCKDIVIPRTLAGGLWGVYGVTGICALFSMAILLKRRIYKTSPNQLVQ